VTGLSVTDLLREGRFETAVIRMGELVRIQDPTEPVDVDAVRARFEETRERLRSVVPPAPFRVVVDRVRSRP
jgi:hypothetical protein